MAALSSVIDRAVEDLNQFLLSFGDQQGRSPEEEVELLIRRSSLLCASLSLVPLPLSDLVTQTPVHLAMVLGIGQLMGQPLSSQERPAILKDLVAVLGWRHLARHGKMALLKLGIPLGGPLLSLPIAYAQAYGLGKLAVRFFRLRAEGRPFDASARDELRNAFNEGHREGMRQAEEEGVRAAAHSVGDSLKTDPPEKTDLPERPVSSATPDTHPSSQPSATTAISTEPHASTTPAIETPIADAPQSESRDASFASSLAAVEDVMAPPAASSGAGPQVGASPVAVISIPARPVAAADIVPDRSNEAPKDVSSEPPAQPSSDAVVVERAPSVPASLPRETGPRDSGAGERFDRSSGSRDHRNMGRDAGGRESNAPNSRDRSWNRPQSRQDERRNDREDVRGNTDRPMDRGSNRGDDVNSGRRDRYDRANDRGNGRGYSANRPARDARNDFTEQPRGDRPRRTDEDTRRGGPVSQPDRATGRPSDRSFDRPNLASGGASESAPPGIEPADRLATAMPSGPNLAGSMEFDPLLTEWIESIEPPGNKTAPIVVHAASAPAPAAKEVEALGPVATESLARYESLTVRNDRPSLSLDERREALRRLQGPPGGDPNHRSGPPPKKVDEEDLYRGETVSERRQRLMQLQTSGNVKVEDAVALLRPSQAVVEREGQARSVAPAHTAPQPTVEVPTMPLPDPGGSAARGAEKPTPARNSGPTQRPTQAPTQPVAARSPTAPESKPKGQKPNPGRRTDSEGGESHAATEPRPIVTPAANVAAVAPATMESKAAPVLEKMPVPRAQPVAVGERPASAAEIVASRADTTARSSNKAPKTAPPPPRTAAKGSTNVTADVKPHAAPSDTKSDPLTEARETNAPNASPSDAAPVSALKGQAIPQKAAVAPKTPPSKPDAGQSGGKKVADVKNASSNVDESTSSKKAVSAGKGSAKSGSQSPSTGKRDAPDVAPAGAEEKAAVTPVSKSVSAPIAKEKSNPVQQKAAAATAPTVAKGKSRPGGAAPSGANPAGAKSSGEKSAGAAPAGAKSSGEKSAGATPAARNPPARTMRQEPLFPGFERPTAKNSPEVAAAQPGSNEGAPASVVPKQNKGQAARAAKPTPAPAVPDSEKVPLSGPTDAKAKPQPRITPPAVASKATGKSSRKPTSEPPAPASASGSPTTEAKLEPVEKEAGAAKSSGAGRSKKATP